MELFGICKCHVTNTDEQHIYRSRPKSSGIDSKETHGSIDKNKHSERWHDQGSLHTVSFALARSVRRILCAQILDMLSYLDLVNKCDM